MAQRRQIRVSRSLEGGGERPATGYGEPEAGGDASSTLRVRVSHAHKMTPPGGFPPGGAHWPKSGNETSVSTA
jgi:hypothetical protein